MSGGLARAQLGKPYQWGATSPGTYDCSGLTMSADASAGVTIPRTSRSQWTIGTHIASMADLRRTTSAPRTHRRIAPVRDQRMLISGRHVHLLVPDELPGALDSRARNAIAGIH